MLTRTLEQSSEQKSITKEIEQKVDERGFYLYEWISPKELRMTLDNDYLTIVRYGSIPLAIIAAITGFIGFAGGIPGSIIAILFVLGLFYLVIFVILFFWFLRKSYLYTRGANVVITDNHFVQGGKVLEKKDKKSISERFSLYEEVFHEKFLEASRLAEKKQTEKKALFENLKEIAMGWGKLIENVGRSRDSGWLILVIILAGFLYSFMMAGVYFIGMFFIALFGRFFWWIAHLYLLAISNKEHIIQNLFSEIDESATLLESEKEKTISLLDEASQNKWQENLLGKINESTALLGKISWDAVQDSIQLRKTLESSQYKDIFNFIKYWNWIKKQILEPIDSILLLLKKNYDTIHKTIVTLEDEAKKVSDPSLQKPLELQKERLLLQKESFDRIITMLEDYKEKLK